MDIKSIKNIIENIFAYIIIIIFLPFWIIYFLLCKRCLQCSEFIHTFPLKKKGQKAIKNELFCSEQCIKRYEKERKQEEKERIEEAKEYSREYVCRVCEYEWESKKRFGSPSQCPHCRSKNIDKYVDTKEGLKALKEELGI